MPIVDSRRACFDANTTFTAVVNSLNILIDDGKFTSEEATRIKSSVASGNRLLDFWTDAVIAGKDSPTYLKLFNVVLEELISYQKGANNGE